MKTLTDLSLLAYLHDAECLGLEWDFKVAEGRSITIRAIVAPDAQYPEWDGREIVLVFWNVVLCRFEGFGGVVGGETLDAFHERLSPEFVIECQRLKDAGVRVPPIRLWISFISGSGLQLVCDQVLFDVGKPKVK
jgi:hypothetical protein